MKKRAPAGMVNRSWCWVLAACFWLGSVGLGFSVAEAQNLNWRSLKRKWPKLWIRSRPCKVYKVIDGDTVHVHCDGKKEKLRLVGIDTPETKHPFKPVEYFGPQASNKAKSSMSRGDSVWLGFAKRGARGKYGRLLAYLFLSNGKMFNAMMVAQGYAFAMRRYPHVYMRRFIKLENKAKRNNRGMWADRSKVRAMVAADKAYRRLKRRCIRKLRLPRRVRFNWVIGDRKTKYYFTRRSRSYFRTNPYTRVLFCSVADATNKGYRAAPYSYRSRRYKRRYRRRYRSGNGSSNDSGTTTRVRRRGTLIIGDTRSNTFRVYRRGKYRIFRSISAAKDAGFRRAKARKRRRRARRRRRRTRRRRTRRRRSSRAGPSRQRPDCGGKTPIVANRRSKKYRLPSMKSYKRATRSKNAVYFCTEQQALDAGYVKSKR